MHSESLNTLTDELQEFTTTVVTRAHLNALDLRRVLSFIVKVSHVAEQAFQDVVTVLIEIKYLTPADLNMERIRDLQKQVDLLTLRSRYRDVEEICSRLHHLSDQYYQQIEPLVRGVADTGNWGNMLGLINEHEGRLINLVHDTTWQLRRRLQTLDSVSQGEELVQLAAEQLEAVQKARDQMRELSNKILGVSGKAGLLELTAEGESTDSITSLFINRGDFFMSRDQYEIGQAGAVGPGAHAENMTFNQIWNKSGNNIDIQQLGRELTTLRAALMKEAYEPEQVVALGEVAAAEKAAMEGDGPTALRHLKNAGVWVWDVATKIGIGVATAAAKTALGI